MPTRKIHFSGIRPFDFELTYGVVRSRREEPSFAPHTHPQCEIYINLSGDVSFMVENRVYPISPGSVILTRPNEFHHCIYHSFTEIHRNIWILFSPSGNETLLRLFFDRPIGENNLIRLGAEALDEIDRLCRGLMEGEGNEPMRHSAFLRILSVLEENRFSGTVRDEAVLPPDIRLALDYIQTHLTSSLTVTEMAAAAHVSVNTLERHFLSTMKITPSAYLKERRLALAQALLRDGKSVMEACEGSGFSDYSHFIALFRKRFDITPLQYQKRQQF